MSIRPAAAEDHPEWLRMRQALWPHASAPEHEAEMAWVLTQPGVVLVSARGDGGLNGFLELSIRSHAEGCEPGAIPYIEGWYVDAEYRRRGVGAALVRAAEAWAREHGYGEIASDTELANHISYQAHRALGYEEVERAIHFRKSLG